MKFNVSLFLVVVIVLVLIALFLPSLSEPQSLFIPENLYKGLIAEAVSEGELGMKAVACCVRNRLRAGNNLGLCGMSRKDLDKFVEKQGVKYERIAKSVVKKVFIENCEDITKGATLFENIERFGWPSDWDPRKVEKTVKIGCHTFFKKL